MKFPISQIFIFLLLSTLAFGGRDLAHGQTASNSAQPVAAPPDDSNCDVGVTASPYVPVDSWIYPAVLRLYSLGYVDSVFLNMRPWTRKNLSEMLDEAEDRFEDVQDTPGVDQAKGIYDALTQELTRLQSNGECGASMSAHLESAYSDERAVSGTPLRDSFHLGSTIVNDYGRPYSNGFNDYTGISGYASAGRFLVYARVEFQGAPSTQGYSPTLAQALAKQDATTNYFNPTCYSLGTTCTPIPYNGQSTIPAGPIASATQGRLLEGYVSAEVLHHIFSFGKQDDWQSPAVGASMSYSNNAQNIYSFRINRIEPLYIPLVSALTGPFRYEFLIGPLQGHSYPIDPWVHVEKVSLHPTANLEFGFERTVIWGGKGHEPINLKSFLRSFFSVTNTSAAVKNSATDPGARFGAFDFSYRLPFLRHWVTLYSDSEVHDDVSPIDAPRRASWRPGIYLSRVPGVAKLDLRFEAVSTDPPVRNSGAGQFMYWESIQRQGYTNSGQMFGDWIGREAKGGQAWATYHLGGNEWIQVSVRNQKVAKDFIAGGTTLNDLNFQVVKRIRKDIEINGTFSYERWKAPIYLPGEQSVTNTNIQVTWYPRGKALSK